MFALDVGLGGLSGDRRVVKARETSPPTIRITLKMRFDCCINLSQASSNNNYK